MAKGGGSRPGPGNMLVATAIVLIASSVMTVVDGHGGAARARAPGQCRSGYNVILWRGPQYGISNVVADPFLRDDVGLLLM